MEFEINDILDSYTYPIEKLKEKYILTKFFCEDGIDVYMVSGILHRAPLKINILHNGVHRTIIV